MEKTSLSSMPQGKRRFARARNVPAFWSRETLETQRKSVVKKNPLLKRLICDARSLQPYSSGANRELDKVRGLRRLGSDISLRERQLRNDAAENKLGVKPEAGSRLKDYEKKVLDVAVGRRFGLPIEDLPANRACLESKLRCGRRREAAQDCPQPALRRP